MSTPIIRIRVLDLCTLSFTSPILRTLAWPEDKPSNIWPEKNLHTNQKAEEAAICCWGLCLPPAKDFSRT